MKHLTVSILLVSLTAYLGLARAHHSTDADSTPGSAITMTAVAKEFHFVNPHPYVAATETTAAGEVKEWKLMLDDRWELVESGFSRSTIQPGDELVVTGKPSRREPSTLYVETMERPSDGFSYQDDDEDEEEDDDR